MTLVTPIGLMNGSLEMFWIPHGKRCSLSQTGEAADITLTEGCVMQPAQDGMKIARSYTALKALKEETGSKGACVRCVQVRSSSVCLLDMNLSRVL